VSLREGGADEAISVTSSAASTILSFTRELKKVKLISINAPGKQLSQIQPYFIFTIIDIK